MDEWCQTPYLKRIRVFLFSSSKSTIAQSKNGKQAEKLKQPVIHNQVELSTAYDGNRYSKRN